MPDDITKVPILLERGILVGLTSDTESAGKPRLIWTVDDNGWVYEARLTNAGAGLYHGYPLLPGDAMAIKVVARFSDWAYEAPEEDLSRCGGFTRQRAVAIVLAAEELYSG